MTAWTDNIVYIDHLEVLFHIEKKKNILKGYLKKLGITGQITNLEKIIQTPKVHTRRGWDDLRE